MHLSQDKASTCGEQDVPTERDLDKALEATFPASDPVALHGDTSPGEPRPKGVEKGARGAQPGRQAGNACKDQSLQAGSERPGERAGSGGEGRRG